MQQLGAADPVDDLDAGRVVERLPDRGRQGLAGRDGAAKAPQLVGLARGQHGAVRGRSRRHDRDASGGDVIGEVGRCGPLDQQRRCAGPDREDQHRAEAEGEGQRRRASEDIIRGRFEYVRRERVSDGQHVPVEMHRGLGPARRSRGERSCQSCGWQAR